MPKFWMSIPVLSGDGELWNYMTLTVGPVSAPGRNAPLIQFLISRPHGVKDIQQYDIC